jgi:hypothetical protein
MQLIEEVNKILLSQSKAVHIYDDALHIKLVDLIFIEDQCFKINSEKFAVFLKQNKMALDNENKN